jgi:hypothetical protein
MASLIDELPSSPFDDSVISLRDMHDDIREKLLAIVDSFYGSKYVIADPDISSLLEGFFPSDGPELRSHNVIGRIMLSPDPSGECVQLAGDIFGRDASPSNLLYMIRPSLAIMGGLCADIKARRAGGLAGSIELYFAPTRSIACEQFLEDQGLLSAVKIHELKLGLVPVDSDLLSLEMSTLTRDYVLDGDSWSLHAIGNTLHDFQNKTKTLTDGTAPAAHATAA